ncbi:hypothetical protein [Streptacidiphilus sp. PB12-B1b]|uniref:hypothetical protein n=1 Tax=Streptacidiphilus sp. PB12-B1b TaxID=2705012 RepID=UPI001CDB737F|nr:hypothetical protein [Streptacidiphilus sp. PB12-B1b]
MTAIVCVALTAAALVIAVLSATRHRYRRAVRWVAVALVPTGLYLTGLLTMFTRIGHAIADWAADLVFDPRVWTGVVMLGAAVLLGLATAVGRRRRRARAVEQAGNARAVPTGAGPAPGALAAGAPAATKGAKAARKQADDEFGEFSDVEEILRRRGL